MQFDDSGQKEKSIVTHIDISLARPNAVTARPALTGSGVIRIRATMRSCAHVRVFGVGKPGIVVRFRSWVSRLFSSLPTRKNKNDFRK